MEKKLNLDTMKVNNITHWNIITNEKIDTSELFLESVKYRNNLVIKLNAKNHKIFVQFDKFISYRVTDESYLLEYWNDLEATGEGAFFKIENSSFLNEMSILSKNFFVDGGGIKLLEHYAIFTISECIEIISDISPKIDIK